MARLRESASASQRARLRAADPHPDLDVRLAGGLYELIPEGEYKAVGIGWRKLAVFKTTKLALEFDVLVTDPEVEFGQRRVRLARFFNVRSGPERRVLAPPSGHYVREWAIVTGRRPSRHDRLSPRVFRGVLCRVEVRTVTANNRQQPFADVLRYSKVARIIERLVGGGQS